MRLLKFLGSFWMYKLKITDSASLLSDETGFSMEISRFIPIIIGIKLEMTISYGFW